jgi:membrane protein involved in colicin uptake
MKPYQTSLFNNYVLANETFYSALIIAIFIFSDATPELSIKVGAAIVLIVSVNLMIISNFVMVVVMTYKGRERLKDEVKRSKLRRAEKELMEEEEEEERRQRQQKEEEDFTKLPEDAEDMADLEDAAAEQLNEIDEGEAKKKKKKKRRDKKKGADDDNLLEFTADGATSMGNTTQGLMNDSKGLSEKKKKKKKRRDKKKDNDDVTEAIIDMPASNPDESNSEKRKKAETDESSNGKKKKKKSKKGDDLSSVTGPTGSGTGPSSSNPDNDLI